MMTWFKSDKPRRLVIGGRKDDAPIDGVLPRWPRYVPTWLDELPSWALVTLFLATPLILFELGFLLVLAPIIALERTTNNGVSGGFVSEYRHAVLGWNHWVDLSCGDRSKRVRISGRSAEAVRARAEQAFPDCRTKSILKTCSGSRRGWLPGIICTPEFFEIEK